MSWDKENASPQGSPQQFQSQTFKTLMKNQPTTFTMDTSDDYDYKNLALSSSDEFGMSEENTGGEFMPVAQPSCASTGGMDQETEDQTDDLFSEWRFELASHLSGEPKLLQRIVRLIERLEQENEDLKEENGDKKARIKDLMHEATCMYERLTSGKTIDNEEAASHKRKFSTRSSPGKKSRDSINSHKRISSSSEGEPENEEKLNKEISDSNQEIKTQTSNKKAVGSFFLGILVSVCSVFIVLVAVAAELKMGTNYGIISFSEFSFLESQTTSTTTTTTLAEDTLQAKLQQSERQQHHLVSRFKEAEAAAVHNQAAASEIQRRYNELSQDHGRMNHDLQILRMFVSRRGPVVDEPGKHCWAEWFTPEICCSPWYGPQGHPGCWSGAINYQSCCGFFSTKDTTSRYAYYSEKALPER